MRVTTRRIIKFHIELKFTIVNCPVWRRANVFCWLLKSIRLNCCRSVALFTHCQAVQLSPLSSYSNNVSWFFLISIICDWRRLSSQNVSILYLCYDKFLLTYVNFCIRIKNFKLFDPNQSKSLSRLTCIIIYTKVDPARSGVEQCSCSLKRCCSLCEA